MQTLFIQLAELTPRQGNFSDIVIMAAGKARVYHSVSTEKTIKTTEQNNY